MWVHTHAHTHKKALLTAYLPERSLFLQQDKYLVQSLFHLCVCVLCLYVCVCDGEVFLGETKWRRVIGRRTARFIKVTAHDGTHFSLAEGSCAPATCSSRPTWEGGREGCREEWKKEREGWWQKESKKQTWVTGRNKSTGEEERARHWWLGQFERQRSSFYISHPAAPRTAGGRRQGGGVEEVCVVWVVLLKGERWGDTFWRCYYYTFTLFWAHRETKKRHTNTHKYPIHTSTHTHIHINEHGLKPTLCLLTSNQIRFINSFVLMQSRYETHTVVHSNYIHFKNIFCTSGNKQFCSLWETYTGNLITLCLKTPEEFCLL